MDPKISVVINTLNESSTIGRCIESVSWADEVLVCDMHSDDETAVIAKKLGAKIIFHKRLKYVEPARNFAISKAAHEWVLILDPDEVIPESLGDKLREIASNDSVITYVEIPRKNLIFGKWIRSSQWWPDYNIRFFRKGAVEWTDTIHLDPKASGQGLKLVEDEAMAIVHFHYISIDQFMDKVMRYSSIQAKQLTSNGYEFSWRDLISKPLAEFLGRYFANRGFEDGVHGLALCLLQAFSFLIVYLKVWQEQGFRQENLRFGEVVKQGKVSGDEIKYWFKYGNLSKNPLKRLLERARNKVI